MANTKITSLTDIASTPASNDVIPIVDVSDNTQASTGTTKKITANRFVFQDGGTVSSALNFSGNNTFSGSVTLSGNNTFSANNTFSGTVTTGKIIPPSNANALITISNPSTTIPTMDIVSGTSAGVTLRLADLTTDGTVKQARMTTRHYNTSQADVMFYYSSNNSTQNIIYYGGASGVFNCVTEHNFYCGTANTQKTGSEIVKITNATMNVNGTVQLDSLRIDQTPTAGTFTNTHYITVDLNGTTYRIPCAV